MIHVMKLELSIIWIICVSVKMGIMIPLIQQNVKVAFLVEPVKEKILV